jgi:hypothetical protein
MQGNKTMNIWKKVKQERMDRLKEGMRPVDATELIRFLMENSEKLSPEDKKIMRQQLEEAFMETGKKFLERALAEDVLSKPEWKALKEKGFTESDMRAVLQAIFNKKDGYVKGDDEIKVLTMDYSPMYKNKAYIEKRFKVSVVTIKDIVEEDKKNGQVL